MNTLKNMFDQNKLCSVFCNKWYMWFLKGLQYAVVVKEVMDASYFFYNSLSDLLLLHKVDLFLSNLLKVFHQYFLYHTDIFPFHNIVFELINIQFLDFIFCNFKIHWRILIAIWLVPSLCSRFITFIIIIFSLESRVKTSGRASSSKYRVS